MQLHINIRNSCHSLNAIQLYYGKWQIRYETCARACRVSDAVEFEI